MNPHTPKWAPTLGVGLSIGSRIFKKWLYGSKLIGLKRSTYHWKALGMSMSKMASYDLIGHLKHKLWSKERSGIILISLCAGGVRHIVEKLSTRDIILLQTSYWLEVWKQNYGPPKSCESQLWEFRDSQLGVLGQNAIWMLVPKSAIEYIIRGKVVASPKSEPWWVLWVRVCPWHILARKVIQLCINWLIVWFVQVHVNDWVIVILLSLILELQHAPLPTKFYEAWNVHSTPCSFVVLTSDSHLSLLRSLGACQMPCWILCFVKILSPKRKGMMIFGWKSKTFWIQIQQDLLEFPKSIKNVTTSIISKPKSF